MPQAVPLIMGVGVTTMSFLVGVVGRSVGFVLDDDVTDVYLGKLGYLFPGVVTFSGEVITEHDHNAAAFVISVVAVPRYPVGKPLPVMR